MMDLTGQSPAVYFYFVDGLGSVTALSNMNGQLVERYVYDAFGKTQILDAGLSVLSASAVGNPTLFTAAGWMSKLPSTTTAPGCTAPPSAGLYKQTPLAIMTQ